MMGLFDSFVLKGNKKTNRAPVPPFLAIGHGKSSESREEELAGFF
jgi:hypothetical protein